MVGAEGPKISEFNTSALLEKALKALGGYKSFGADTAFAVSKSWWIHCRPKLKGNTPFFCSYFVFILLLKMVILESNEDPVSIAN